MQLISFLKRENNVKFSKFKYLMWTKVQPIIPSKRSGSAQCLVVRVPRQVIFTTSVLVFLILDVRDLQSFSDALKVGLLVFLELWLGKYPLSCGSG